MQKKLKKIIVRCLPPEFRDYLFGLKRFRTKNRNFTQPMIIFFAEKGKWHGGFADRMKGIVTLYHYCLCKNIAFKINHTFPFVLSDFLLPNEYNWQIDSKEIGFNRKETKILNLIGDNTIKRLIKLKTEKQIHAFANRDVVGLLNGYYSVFYTWGELFKKLFKPAEDLQNMIDEHLKIIDGDYICATFRFQNLLGDFFEYDYKPLKEAEQTNLIKKCSKALLELQKKEDLKKILITSDSVKFLNYIRDLENIFAFPYKIVHIDCVANEENSVYMKSFLDFYLLSKGKKNFCIGTKEMYPSEFPMYAAKMNDAPFERISII
jgi:hypothetical protein